MEEGMKNIPNELKNEYARASMQGGVKCKAMCNIFEGRSCGERAELIFNVANSDEIYDKMMTGAWLTWSITDHLIKGSSFSTIYFYNDGFNQINDPSKVFTKINTIATIPPDKLEA
jgi:hypothetical protein